MEDGVWKPDVENCALRVYSDGMGEGVEERVTGTEGE